MKENFENLNKPKENVAEKKEDAEKVIFETYLQRHGPKLSASGEKNEKAQHFSASVEKGFEEMGIQEGKGLVHISSSPIERAVDTAAIDLERVSATEHRHKNISSKQEKLEVPFQPLGEAEKEQDTKDLEIIVKLQKSLEPLIRDKVNQEHPDFSVEEKEAEVRNFIDIKVLTILFDSEKAEQKGFHTSYEDLADKLAKRYSGFLKHTGLLASNRDLGNLQPKDESYKQIDISHSFPIMSLLKKYLVFEDGTPAKELRAEDFFERTGGVIKESQSLKLEYVKEDGKYGIKVQGNFSGNKSFSGKLNFK